MGQHICIDLRVCHRVQTQTSQILKPHVQVLIDFGSGDKWLQIGGTADERRHQFDGRMDTDFADGGQNLGIVGLVESSLVLNPGSVGLSLNGEPGADYALLSISEDGIELEMDKVEYDFAAVAFDIVAWGLPSMVAEAVQMGRLPENMTEDTR